MKVKVCNLVLVGLLPLLAAACAAESRTNRPVPKADSGVVNVTDPEEYLVYSTLIERKYVRPDVRLIVISDRTLAHTAGYERLDKTMEVIGARLNVTDQGLLDDFLTKNKQSCGLEGRFNLKVDHVRVSEDDKKLLSQSGDFWNAFDEKYPNAQGIIGLSRVGFNPAKDRALVYIGNNGGASTGAGYYVLLTKSEGQWVTQGEAAAWVI